MRTAAVYTSDSCFEHFVHVIGNFRFSACGKKLDGTWWGGDTFKCKACEAALQYPIHENQEYREWLETRGASACYPPYRPRIHVQTQSECAYCGLDKKDAPNPKYIEQYNIILEALIHLNIIHLNIIHPETRTRLEDPAGEYRIAYNNDWVNRIVERVARLRVTRQDEGAKAIVDTGTFLKSTGTFFYRCVCLRSSGVKEGPEGELI